MEYIGEHLKKIRKDNKLSMLEVQRACGLDTSTLSRYEMGKLFPSVNHLIKLSVVYEINLDDLIFRTVVNKANMTLVNHNIKVHQIKDYTGGPMAEQLERCINEKAKKTR